MAAINQPPVLPAPRRTSFHQGWHWLISAANLVATSPWQYLPALFWLLFIGSLQWIIPGAGSFLSGLLAPLSIAPLLLTFALQSQRQSNPNQPHRGSGLMFQQLLASAQLLPLLRLGFYLMLVVLVLSQISGWLMSRLLDADVLSALEKQDLKQLALMPKHELMLILSLTALPMATLGLLAWLSIPLVLFYRAPIPQVLSLSLKTSLRNWRALLAMNILLTIVCLGALVILSVVTVVGHAISSQLGTLLSSLLLLAFSCFMQVALVGAQYLACQDIFGHHDNGAETPGNPLAQGETNSSSDKEQTSGYWQA